MTLLYEVQKQAELLSLLEFIREVILREEYISGCMSKGNVLFNDFIYFIVVWGYIVAFTKVFTMFSS
jgi:hypothetical protein